MRNSIIFIFLLLSGIEVYSQEIVLKGLVLDSLESTPIDFSSVYVMDENSRIIAFGNTNEEGKFSFVINDKKPFKVVASMLGYGKKELLYEKETQHYVFKLTSADFSLEEVIIKESAASIFERNDTTTYKVANFIDSTEHSVEDLLKKLPGFQINEGGGITINGKAVKTVMYEGDAIFEQNYTLGTKNLRAGIVDDVQVINHFEDNPLMKKVQNSDEIAINIRLKKSKKNVVSGSFQAGAGYGEDLKTFFEGSLFSISKKSKSVLLSNYNTIGFDPIGELSAQFSENDILDAKGDRSFEYLTFPSPLTMGLPNTFGQNQRIGLLNVAQSLQLSSTFKVKLEALYVDEKASQTNFNTTRWNVDTGQIVFSETNSLDNANRVYNLLVKTDYFSNKHELSLRTSTEFDRQPRNTTLQIERLQNGLATQIPSDFNEMPNDFKTGFELTKGVGDKQLLQLDYSFSYTENEESMALSNYWIPTFSTDSTVNNMAQQVAIKAQKHTGLVRYLNSKHGFWQVDVGASINQFNLDSDLLVFGRPTSPVFNRRSQSELEERSVFSKISWKKHFNAIRILAGIRGFLTSFHPISTELNPYYSAYLKLTLFEEKQHSWELNYMPSATAPPINQLYTDFIVTDYQNQQRGLDSVFAMREQKVSSMFRYRSLDHFTQFYAKLDVSFRDGDLGNQFILSERFFSNTLGPVSTKQYGAELNYSTFLLDYFSRIRLNYHYSILESEQVVNQSLQLFQTRAHSIQAEYGSAFDIPINFILNNKLLFQKNSIEDAGGTFANQNIINSLEAKTIIDLPEDIRLEVTMFHQFSNTVGVFRNSYAGWQASAYYNFNINKKPQSLSLEISNLLNRGTFAANGATNLIENQFGMVAAPLFFILKWDVGL